MLEDGCPPDEEIAVFLRGGRDRERRRMLEAHVARCSACRRLLSALVGTGAESSSSAGSLSPTVPAEPVGAEADLTPGVRFGRYAVLGLLGRGGMGVVYAAHDPELHRKVALKVLRHGEASDQVPLRDSLLSEARAMAQLAHPNVVTVYDIGTIDGRVFIAMELVEGPTLARWLTASPHSQSDVIAAFVAAGLGLAAAHAAGLIHRDFKPDNVLIGNDGRVRVTDFGLARAAPPEQAEPEHRGAADVRGGAASHTGLAGTLAYMAPEQFLRRRPDARADQFSFAVALYEALHGERPFGVPPFADAPPVRASHAEVPAAVQRVLLRALSRDPGGRWASMTEMLAALTPRPRRGRAAVIGASAIASIAALAIAGYAIHLRQVAARQTELVRRLRGLVPDLSSPYLVGLEKPPCTARDDGNWSCHNRIPAAMYRPGADPRSDANVDFLRTNPSWFVCRAEGAFSGGGLHEHRWVWTQGDDDNGWGWVRDIDIVDDTEPIRPCFDGASSPPIARPGFTPPAPPRL